MTITLRQESDSRATTKGSALTFTELDNNFKDILDRATLIVEDSTNTTASIGTASPELKITGTGSISTAVTTDSLGGGVLTIASTAITDIQNDSSPQLGGNLDVNGQQIVSVSNGNIVLTPNGTGQVQTTNLRYDEDIHDLGTTGGTITPDVANGNVQTITLNNNLTFNAFSNPIAGQSLTLVIDTDGTGRTLTSTMKFAGGTKTLSTTDTFDIMTVFYDGTRYYANLVVNYS
ncbi:MAG: hypothetical protein CMK29_00055 [Porticoccaceae bacterium]|jgi:hypothetical protein|nr:hypothetical protein [Porticoccaceae bacterium]|tara:strand:- start:2929 stop:3627 length:699 start_codon:yes stop_codon:yes gene_type:complete